MKVGTVVSAVNLNPRYTQFVGQFIKAWTSLFPEVRLIIVLVADAIPDELRQYEPYLHLFAAPEGLSDVLVAQCIRLLWPRFLDSEDGVLITDIDMLPMSRPYYTKPLVHLAPDTVVVYRTDGVFVSGNPREIYMCYVCASPRSWRGLFGTEPHDVVLRRWSENSHWGTDQGELTVAYRNWKGPKVVLTDAQTGFRRLCRSYLNRPRGTPEREIFEDRPLLRRLVWTEFFADYHLPSNDSHREINDYVVDLLTKQPKRDAFIPADYMTSYAPLLYNALVSTEGTLIECGMGDYSSHLLHGTGRHVISYETSPDWFAKFPDIESKQLIGRDDWLNVMAQHKPSAAVIFLDHAPGESREKCLAYLANGYKGIVVCHDTEPGADHGYKMRQHFNWFKYVAEVKCHGAWATVLSHTHDVTQWVGQKFGDFTIQEYTGRPDHFLRRR
jgi:hypothetical protein